MGFSKALLGIILLLSKNLLFTVEGLGEFHCPNNDCRVWWGDVIEDKHIEFGVEGTVDTEQDYVSFAFSKDAKMGDDGVYICFKNGNNYELRRAYNDFHTPIIYTENLAAELKLQPSYLNGRLTCKFLIPVNKDQDFTKPPVGHIIFYPLDQQYYLLYAQGKVVSPEKLAYHDRKYPSASAIDFAAASVDVGSGSSSKALIKAHGILMVIAWLICASTGSLLPRYYKSSWPDTKLFNGPIWFRLHQILMSSTLILTLIAFIIIFVHVQGYAQSPLGIDAAHPPVGIIVTILVVINPLMSLIRCHPDHRHRWIFNVAHLLVGQFAIVLAVVAIYLSMLMKKANLAKWVQGVMGAAICWHVLMELVLMSHDRYLASLPSDLGADKKGPVPEREEELSMEKSPKPKVDKKSLVKTILVASQWIGVGGMAIAICVGIGIAE